MDRLDELAGPHEQWCHGYAHGDCCGASDCDCGRDERRVAIAVALAEEREKARAPFLALAEELEREGQNEEAEAKKLGKSVTAESWWGSGAASLDAAARIRRAAEVTL